MLKAAMLGTGFISGFYVESIQDNRSQDKVQIVYSRDTKRASDFAEKYGIPEHTTDLQAAVNHPDIQVVVIGLPNNLHKEAAIEAAKAGKAVLCTKPLGRNAEEAWEMLKAVEEAGVFHGYLEDLVYTPKMFKSLQSVSEGAIGDVLWVRSREAHSGPHSSWFWDKEQSGGGAMLDLACHCIEIARNFIGKEMKPLEVVCWAATQVKPIDAEDHAIGLVKYSNGAIGQFESSWVFRGGLDIRDEVVGTEGTIWLDNFLRTGLEMFTTPGQKSYVAEKADSESGWLFPVADENYELGNIHMFREMFNAIESGESPMEDFYDGYVVNEIIDACFRSAASKKWEPVALKEWRGKDEEQEGGPGLIDYDKDFYLVKEEKMPGGEVKLILKDKSTGKIIERKVDS